MLPLRVTPPVPDWFISRLVSGLPTPILPPIVVRAEPERISNSWAPLSVPVMPTVPPPPLDVSITIAPVAKATLPVIDKFPLPFVFTFLFKVVVAAVMVMSFISVVTPVSYTHLTLPTR